MNFKRLFEIVGVGFGGIMALLMISAVFLAGVLCLILGLFYLISDERQYNPNPIYLEFPERTEQSSSSNMELVAQANLGNLGYDPLVIFPRSELELWFDFFENDLVVMALSNSGVIKTLGTYHSSSGLRDVEVRGSQIFLGLPDGLEILDISNPSDPKPMGKFQTSRSIVHISLDSDRAYLIDDQAGFYILDILTPAHPKLIHYFRKLLDFDQINGMTTGDNLIYLNDCSRLFILDFSNITDPKIIGSYVLRYGFCPRSPRDGGNQVVIIENIAFLTEMYKASFDPVIVTHLSLLDVSDPAHPEYLGAFDWHEESSIHGTSLDFVCLQFDNKIRLLDFSNPVKPAELGKFEIPILERNYTQYSMNLGNDGRVYILDRESNIYILEYTP